MIQQSPLNWLWQLFHNVYIYQNITLESLNKYNFNLSKINKYILKNNVKVQKNIFI